MFYNLVDPQDPEPGPGTRGLEASSYWLRWPLPSFLSSGPGRDFYFLENDRTGGSPSSARDPVPGTQSPNRTGGGRKQARDGGPATRLAGP